MTSACAPNKAATDQATLCEQMLSVRIQSSVDFEIVSEISGIETFTSGTALRNRARRTGIGRKEFKIKHFLD